MARIAVIGAGAVGCYYGARLAAAGHDVRFLMRRDLDAVRGHGLTVGSVDGDLRLPVVSAFGSSDEIGVCEWVVVSLKTTALDSARALIEPCVGPATRVVFLLNGLGVEEEFAEWIPPERVFGGMAFVCINRGDPGWIHHLAYGTVTLGHLLDDPMEVERGVALLEGAGIAVAPAPDLLRARWEKLCWNIPFNGLSVAAGGVGTRTLISDAELRGMAHEAMLETVRAGNADLERAGNKPRLDSDDIVTRMFAQTESMGDYRTSMVIDYVLGRPLEVERILSEPVRRARTMGVAVPTVAAIHAIVAARDRQRRGIDAVLDAEGIKDPGFGL